MFKFIVSEKKHCTETESYSTDYSTTASTSSLELNDIDTNTRELLSRFRAKLQSEVQRINESGEDSDTDSTLTTTTTDSSESSAFTDSNVATISGSIQRPGESFLRKRKVCYFSTKFTIEYGAFFL